MAYGRHAGVSGYRLPWFRVVAIAALVVFVVLSLSRLSVFKRESIPLFSKKLDTLYNKVKNEWAESPKMPAMPGIENLSERIRVCTEKFGDPKFQVVTVPASAAHPSFHMAVYKEEDIVSNNIANVGTWEPAEVSEMFLTYSSPKSMEGKLFVDIGANVGWFSLIALAKGYEVLALEPAPANIQLIKFSMCLNPGFSDRFTFFENGLSEDTKTCYVISDDQNIGDGTTACDEESKYRMLNSTNPKYRVRSQAQFLRLDDVYYNRLPQPARPIGLLKIDIEGHEVHAFAKAGAGRLFSDFSRRPPVIFSELFHCQGNNCEEDRPYVEVMMNEYGYEALRIPLKDNYETINGVSSLRKLKSFEELTTPPSINIVYVEKDFVLQQ